MSGARKVMIICGLGLCLAVLPALAGALSPEVRDLGQTVNSAASDFAPVVSPDGNSLFFASDRAGGLGGQDIWVSERKNGEWSAPRNLGAPVNDQFNQGPDCFYANNGKQYLFITYCNQASEGMCDIYIGEKGGDGLWGKPKSLGAPINTDYSEANASWDYVNKVLYFVSTRPGGMSGEGPKRLPRESSYDIWSSRLGDDGTWGQPANLGAPVNTPGWEGVAFYLAADQSLYFSSDGHGGMGGADIFRSVHNTDGTWSEPEPVNVVNTADNDMYFSIPAAGDVAYFSSIMDGGLGEEDIYMAPLDIILSPEILAQRTMMMPAARVARGPGAGHIETIYFEFDKSALRASETAKLEKVVDFLNQNLGARVEFQGHADSVGADDYNLILSKRRADAVANYLMNNKINPDRIDESFYGETKPAEPNDPAKGNPLNRRVEISVK
ncbi:MAG TPA: OmpA family protein [bacterium]|nr:OmpA family protein [bacterium]